MAGQDPAADIRRETQACRVGLRWRMGTWRSRVGSTWIVDRRSKRATAHSPVCIDAPDAIDDPLVVVALEVRAQTGRPISPEPLLAHFASKQLGYGRSNRRRYRWGLSSESQPGSNAYRLAPGSSRTCWRPAELAARGLEVGDSAFGIRLMEPIELAAQFGYWGRVADDPTMSPAVRSGAALLLDEATPIAEHDLASWFEALDPWRDTFALWLLSAESEAIVRLRDLIFALATRYGGLASRAGGAVMGTRFPFFETRLVSASAHLALGLWRCGVYPSVVPSLVDFVARSRHGSGAWADGEQQPDVLTTLAAADLLARLDPTFDPTPTAAWFVERQEPAGWWRALNPEVPWLTQAITGWLERIARPFSERFAWPSAPIWARDRLTGLTTMAILDELETVLAGVPGLAALPIEAAFLDLAGFGDFNSRQGQVAGDEVLATLGASLSDLDGVLPVRIGGDEFLLFGKPGAVSGSLAASLEPWRDQWAVAMAVDHPTECVAPRIVWSD